MKLDALIDIRETLNETILNSGNTDAFLVVAASDILGIAKVVIQRGLTELSVVPFSLLLTEIFEEARELPSDTVKRIQALRAVSLYIDRIADCYEAEVEAKGRRNLIS